MSNSCSFFNAKTLLPLSLMIVLSVGFCLLEFMPVSNQMKHVFIPILVIAFMGVSHGSLDHVVYRKKVKSFKLGKLKFGFFSIYLLLLSTVVVLWQINPLFALIAFLFISVVHFGLDDSEGSKVNREIEAFVRGLAPIAIPCFRFPDEVSLYFSQLTGPIGSFSITADAIYFYSSIATILLVISSLYLLYSFESNSSILGLVEIVAVLFVFWNFSPLVAFTCYFCGIHSTKKILSISSLLSKKSLASGIVQFYKLSFLPTLVTLAVSAGCVFALVQFLPVDEACVKVTFIALNALTLPHILLPCLANIDSRKYHQGQPQRS